jgi:hypothetical protein
MDDRSMVGIIDFISKMLTFHVNDGRASMQRYRVMKITQIPYQPIKKLRGEDAQWSTQA